MIIRTAKELGQLIRDQRSRKDLTQAQLADLVGVSRKWIIDFESGKRTTDLSLVLLTINALELELDAHVREKHARGKDVDVNEIIAASQVEKSSSVHR